METSDSAFEAGVELDQEALVQAQTTHDRQRGKKAAKAAKGGVEINTETEDDAENETSPLLSRKKSDAGDNGSDVGENGIEDLSNLPWWNRPSVYWILGPFLIMALAFGGIMTPKINLILQLICREYVNEMGAKDPSLKLPAVDFSGGENDQCRIPAVQSRVANFMLWCALLQGLLSALAAPKLGALSDRYGRKVILLSTGIGTILGELVTIAAARNPETFPVGWMLLSYALDGLTGSFIVAMAIANSYATDCTPPSMRNVAFGFFHGCLFTGLAVGPIIAGYVARASGSIVTCFYVLLAAHGFFIIFIGFVVPESLSKKRQLLARDKHKSWLAELGPQMDWINSIRQYNVLGPLAVLWPRGEGSSPQLRRNLLFLSAVDTIVFGVAMGSLTVVVIYTNYQFGWTTFETSRFMSIVNTCRVLCLVVVLPGITWVRRKRANRSKQPDTGSDLFDLSIIRLAIFFDTLGYLGYTLSRTGPLLTLSGSVAAIGGIGSPTLQSALTRHVPADQTGQLLGAIGLLHALARVVAPTIFNAIYSATVGRFTQTVFVCLTATFGVAFILSWFIAPHVYHDGASYPDSMAGEGESGEEDEGTSTPRKQQKERRARLPIVESVTAALAAVGIALGFLSAESSAAAATS
ncbi:MFS general substrate transporter [Polychaeton citri CBS 116435]|uniref:MFS general substrate transporter n=1 Tax=Polychaeton citri CBS 116435 TaxID=1314669 RepID=A0A9P4Q0U5_9PEZI|nr:MFS general substrate transporter [Polychaeton citri CBS 116435]